MENVNQAPLAMPRTCDPDRRPMSAIVLAARQDSARAGRLGAAACPGRASALRRKTSRANRHGRAVNSPKPGMRPERRMPIYAVVIEQAPRSRLMGCPATISQGSTRKG
jgi:hypothetical protein